MSDTNFVFLAEKLALDLVNTEVIARGKKWDLLQTPQDLATWWKLANQQTYSLVAVQGGKTIIDETALAEIKIIRGNLRSLFSAVVEEKAIPEKILAELNQVLANASRAFSLTPEGKLQEVQQISQPQNSVLSLQVVLSALELLTQPDLQRLHKCRNERCILFYYDTTKSATRHWCSTGCMNRARSIQNYQKSKLFAHGVVPGEEA